LFADEERLPRGELHHALGDALLEGLLEAVRQFQRSDRVQRTFRARFRERANAERFLDALTRRAKSVQIVPGGIEHEGDYHVLTFDRVYPTMTGLLGNLLGGGTMHD